MYKQIFLYLFIVCISFSPSFSLLAQDDEAEMQKTAMELKKLEASQKELFDMAKKFQSMPPEKREAAMAEYIKDMATSEKGAKLALAVLGPMQKMPAEEIKRSILENENVKKYLGTFLLNNPVVLDSVVNVMKSEEALPSLIKIPQDRKKGLIFLGCNILTIIFGFFLKRRMSSFNVDDSFMIGLKNFFKRMFLLYAIRFSLMAYFYHVELGPLVKVVYNTFTA